MSDEIPIPDLSRATEAPVIARGVPQDFTLFDVATGEIRALLRCAPEDLLTNVPPGLAEVRGHHNAHNRRVDPVTREVVPFQRPAPDNDHVWNTEREEWELPPAVAAARADSIMALREIAALEAQQARAMREIVLARGNPAEARARLESIDDTIAQLRTKILP